MGGTPRGEMERVSDSIQVDRYHAKPADGVVVSDKIAVVVFYDILGFSIVSSTESRRGVRGIKQDLHARLPNMQPNPKIIADAYADKLKLNVYVPDYLRECILSPGLTRSQPAAIAVYRVLGRALPTPEGRSGLDWLRVG